MSLAVAGVVLRNKDWALNTCGLQLSPSQAAGLHTEVFRNFVTVLNQRRNLVAMCIQPTPCRPSLQVSSKNSGACPQAENEHRSVRRNIFCTVMTSEDFLDTFEAPEVSPVCASYLAS